MLDDLSAGKENNLAGVRDKIDFHRGSITDLETVQKACAGADFVIHLAARTSVPRSVKDPIESNRVNIDGTLNVLVAARDAKVRRVVYAASSSAYGETPDVYKRQVYHYTHLSYVGLPQSIGDNVFNFVYGKKITGRLALRVFGGPDITNFSVPIGGVTREITGSGGGSLTYAINRGGLSLNYDHGVTGGSGVLVGSETCLLYTSRCV